MKRFLEEHGNTPALVVTYKDNIFSNQECLHYDEDILNCSKEEADQRLVCHAYNCVRNEIQSIVVSTNDTDVIMLLVANFPTMFNIESDIKLYW